MPESNPIDLGTSRSLRVLFITRAYGEHQGGMERLSYELISEVGKVPNMKASALAHKGPKWLAPLFVFTVIPAALAAAKSVNIIHIGDPVLSFTGWIIKKITGKPVAVSVHGLDVTFSNYLYQSYLKLFFRRLDLYLPISGHVTKLLQREQAIDNQAITTINPGIRDRFYDLSVKRENLRQLLATRYSLQTNDRVLFTSGRLVKRKGHAWFIEHVLPTLPRNVLYLIAGTGPEEEVIKKSATNRVIILGRVAEDDLKILYNTIDVFVQPNITVTDDAEGFGLVMLEAALCNRPVIASQLEGITDAIQPEINGKLVEAGNVDAWVQAIQDTLTSSPSSQARSYTLQQYNWPKQAQLIANALTTVAR